MIELAHHIEALLLENDCVIIPGFGGFVAHYTPAERIDEENRFLPPTRLIGFNPQLQMNDGLLAQSYMGVYGTNFPDATKMVEKKVDELLELLRSEGRAELPNVGELYCSIHGNYEFRPYDHRITTPGLYGLDSFEMSELKQLSSGSVKTDTDCREEAAGRNPRRPEIEIDFAAIARVAAMIAVAVTCFFFSTPIENTEVVKANYAQMLPEGWFEGEGQRSLAINPVVTHQSAKETKKSARPSKNVSPVKAVEKKVEKPAPSASEVKGTVAVAKRYHIIVASVGTEKDALAMAEELKAKGYAEAQAVIADGKKRVSIGAYSTHTEAMKDLSIIRQNMAYQGAWVLKK